MSSRDELRRYVHLLADMWTPAKVTDERVERLYATVRAEVLAEADLLPKADVVTWLTKKAREFRANDQPQQANTAALLASQVDRSAVRPNNLRMPPPDFFEADRTYTSGRWANTPGTITHTTRTFTVTHIETSPDGSKRVAIGWEQIDGKPYLLGVEDMDGWTLTNGGGEGQ